MLSCAILGACSQTAGSANRTPTESATTQIRTRPLFLGSYEVSTVDNRTLIVLLRTCDPKIVRTDVDETDDEVVITIYEATPDPNQDITDCLSTTQVHLAAPLGDRLVIDGYNSKPLPKEPTP